MASPLQSSPLPRPLSISATAPEAMTNSECPRAYYYSQLIISGSAVSADKSPGPPLPRRATRAVVTGFGEYYRKRSLSLAGGGRFDTGKGSGLPPGTSP